MTGRTLAGRALAGPVLGAPVLIVWALLALSACTPAVTPMGPRAVAPQLRDDKIVAADGAELPLTIWRPAGEPRAAILALHGFNDYSIAFMDPAESWAKQGIITYAYDQRGFGRAPQFGMWAGIDTLTADIESAAALIRARHPDVPFAVLGESMGAGLAMVAASRGQLPPDTGLILTAPAVRGRDTMNVFQRAGLWFFAHTVPWLAGAPGGVPIFHPSDNIAMLRKMGRDPLVIKDTRVDTFYGLIGLMDAALDASYRLEAPALIQIGAKDDLIPGEPNEAMLRRLPPVAPGRRTVAIYPKGYHMLLRDLDAHDPVEDITFWVLHRGAASAALPSRADRNVFMDPATGEITQKPN